MSKEGIFGNFDFSFPVLAIGGAGWYNEGVRGNRCKSCASPSPSGADPCASSPGGRTPGTGHWRKLRRPDAKCAKPEYPNPCSMHSCGNREGANSL